MDLKVLTAERDANLDATVQIAHSTVQIAHSNAQDATNIFTHVEKYVARCIVVSQV